jgi:hypothetical protein
MPGGMEMYGCLHSAILPVPCSTGTDADNEAGRSEEEAMVRIVLCVACFVIVAGGCGKGQETVTVGGGPEGGGFEATMGEGAAIPKDFPSDVFLYESATVTAVIDTDDGYTVSAVTKDDKGKIIEACKKKMTAQGWTQESSVTMGPQSVLVYEKGKRTANIAIGTVGDQIQVNVTVTKP